MTNKLHSFRKDERLASFKQINALFAAGKSIKSGCVQMIYLIEPSTNFSVKILFSVPKKLFPRAVDRNFIKRRMRESYRSEKYLFSGASDKSTVQISAAVIYKCPDLKDYREIHENVKVILNKLAIIVLKFINL